MRKLPKATTRPSAASWTGRPSSTLPGRRRHKSTSAGNSSPRQILPKRHLAQVRPEPLSELWFTASSPRFGPADELLGPPPPGKDNDHQPPDKRLLKLGKSEISLPSRTCKVNKSLTKDDSTTTTVSSPARHPHETTPSRDPLPGRNTPPLPLDAPPSPGRQGQGRVPSRAMDFPGRLGMCTHRRKREAEDHLGKDCPDRVHIRHTTRRR